MDEDTIALRRLEELMTQFFSPGATNDQIKRIELSLHEFSSQIHSWRPCLHFLSSTNNHYVSMFSLSTLETTIKQRWPILAWEDRALIRSTLYTLSLEHGVATFVRNKIVKLIVDIAKHDWPHFYPDFFSNILQLLGHKQSRLLGLIYLKTASEELATPREDLPIQRRSELLKLLNNQVGTTLEALTGLLCETIQVQLRSGTVTPPSSPTGAQNLLSRNDINVDNLNARNSELCIAILEVLAHLFSWIIPTDHISVNLLTALFTCARYHNSMNTKQIEMSILAMTTINELLYRPYPPNVTDTFILQIFTNGIVLFQTMESLEMIDESYMEKTTEFLQLFITNHLKRIESCSKFPINTFFEILYYHTFQQCKTVNCYLRCLEIWNVLLENTQSKYINICLPLAEKILQKISFKVNGNTLKNLDTQVLNENDETEWQHYLRCNIECLAKIGEITPTPIFTLLYNSWRQDLIIYGELGNALINGQVLLLNDNDANNIDKHLRDLSSITQALARLCVLFLIDNNQNDNQSLTEELINQTLDACQFSKTHQLYQCSLQPAFIVIDIIQVHSQFLASLQAWSHWLVKQPDRLKDNLCQRFIDSCFWTLDYLKMCDNLQQQLPDNLIHSAVHLFQSITSILKPNLWDQLTFRNLICINNYSCIKPDTVQVLRRGLINGLILANGDNVLRQKLINTFITTLSKPLGNEDDIVPSEMDINNSITPLKQLLEDCCSSSTTIKKILHQSLQPTINRVLKLITHLIKSQICEILMNFIHTIFLVLQQQLGTEFTQNAVQGLLYIYTNENINVGPALDQLLEILIIIISIPNSQFKIFIPSVITLCLNQIWPTINNNLNLNPDTTLVFIRLLHCILIHQWQYFYSASVLRTFKGNKINSNSNDQQDDDDDNKFIQHKEELVAILEAFGQALLQSDVNIFRHSLQSLEQINTRWRLYQKSIFKNHLLERFLVALFTVLIQRSHNLLSDEIAVAVHSLASVNITWFFNHFLPSFLTNCQGLDDIQRATLLNNFDKSIDQPTLTRSVLRLISDLRCYQLCQPI